MGFVHTHPYLVGNLAWLGVLVAVSPRLGPADYRCSVWLGGLACLPCVLLALMHEGSYWQPVRWLPTRLGPEDAVFAFDAGATAWLAATLPQRAAVCVRVGRGAVGRYLALLAAGAILTGGLDLVGLSGFENSLVAATMLAAALLIRRPARLRIAVSGLVVFVPIYALIVKLQLAGWPHYIHQWNSAHPLSRTVWGLPMGEIVWAAVFAVAWPVCIAAVLGVLPRMSAEAGDPKVGGSRTGI